MKDAVAARAASAVHDAAAEHLDVSFPIGTDTAFRCMIALMFVRLGMRIVVLGAKVLTPVHPGRRSYETAVLAWEERTTMMPWRGFVPSGGLITVAQALWVVLVLVTIDVTLYVVGLPHVRMHGLLHHLPHFAVRLVHPH